MLKLLKLKTGEGIRENTEKETDNETRSFYTPTKSVRINSTQNNDQIVSRNNKNNQKVSKRSFLQLPMHFQCALTTFKPKIYVLL